MDSHHSNNSVESINDGRSKIRDFFTGSPLVTLYEKGSFRLIRLSFSLTRSSIVSWLAPSLVSTIMSVAVLPSTHARNVGMASGSALLFYEERRMR